MKICKIRGNILIAYLLILGGFLLGAMLGSRTVTAFAEARQQTARHLVVIDPGHGGEDGGATSCTGCLESQINLEISLRLRDLLHFLGYDTKMVRESDMSVYTQGDTIAAKKVSDLKQRVKLVNETENALLLSIHQNQFSDGRYHGAQVFYGMDSESEELAKAMQSLFVETLNPGSRRQCKKSTGVYLMEHIRCPGVLVECGFLSNPEEEGKLRSPEYQKDICCVIASAVTMFLQNRTTA